MKQNILPIIEVFRGNLSRVFEYDMDKEEIIVITIDNNTLLPISKVCVNKKLNMRMQV